MSERKMENKICGTVPFTAEMKTMAQAFHSGNDYLDHFLRGAEAIACEFGKTYVLLSAEGGDIIGYYNIGVGSLEQNTEYGRRKLGGAVHINCFALDERYHHVWQGKTEDGKDVYLSDVLLNECIQRIGQIRENQVGFSFITLCATKQGCSLYKRADFEVLDEDMDFSIGETDKNCILMYLPLDYE